MFFDPLWFVFVGPAMLLAWWAQAKVHGAFARAKQIPARSGITGAETAARILLQAGVDNVGIEPTQGVLGDHYDPRHKVLRLSPDVYNGRSVAAQGIAAHEVGHAIQDARRYGPLILRNGLVPLASTGSWLSNILIIGGILFMFLVQGASQIAYYLIWAGVIAFATTVVFQLINLPVEFDASKRAKAALADMGLVTEQEMPEVRRVLNAAAMTYVAATAVAIMQLLYWIVRLSAMRRE